MNSDGHLPSFCRVTVLCW